MSGSGSKEKKSSKKEKLPKETKVDLEKEREEYERPMKQLYWNNEYLPIINNSYNNSKLPGYTYDHAELNKM